ncbi:MAG: 2-succinyl-6-hydroxy-2,4-cyclohexadiene-1-carboxylate synthase, partial [Solirubrobacteraceae bacterium]
GVMAPMWDRLRELRMPVAVVVGADDSAYEATGRRLAAAIENAKLRAVAGVGHRVALQAPDAVVDALAGA